MLSLPSSEKLKLVTLHFAVNTGDETQHTTHKSMPIKSVDGLANLYPECFVKNGSIPGSIKLTVNINMQPDEILSCAWEVVRTDLFYFDCHKYLIIADYYSKFPIIHRMTGQYTGHINTKSGILRIQHSYKSSQ